MDVDPAWSEPTWFLDSESPEVDDFARTAVDGATDRREMAIRLFYAVRDGFRYDPYALDREREAYRASSVVGRDSGWCVPKSIVLTAAARNRGIPARLGFADVRNHLTSEKLMETMGTDLFAWHGYAELLLDGEWRKLSTAFNIELCERFGVKALEFDGDSDALMHPYDTAGNRHMEYVRQRGSFDDLPFEEMFATFAELYPNSMMRSSNASSAEAAGDDAFSGRD
jgi:transglutaminase-like putative cysteine protease